MEHLPVTLLDLLQNSLILRQTAPYLPPPTLLNLAATSRAFREVLYRQPEAWRYLDLSTVPYAAIDSSPIDIGGISWRAQRMDESLTEDDFYAGPLRGILGHLHRKDLLRNVQTLILDGLSVPADLVREIVTDDQRYRVRTLSIREATHLNHSKLRQVLEYIVRPTRPEGTPSLRALYVFGSKDHTNRPGTASYWRRRLKDSGRSTHKPPPSPVAAIGGVMSAEGAQIGAQWNYKSSMALDSSLARDDGTCSSDEDDDERRWYSSSGKFRRPHADWAHTLQACQGLIAFDAVLCRGPRHDINKTPDRRYLGPAIATVALGPAGCHSCGSSPEGPAVFGLSNESALPLIAPPPSHSSTVRAAQRPDRRSISSGSFPPLFLRCEECLTDRLCGRCNRWWCEDCDDGPASGSLRLQSDGQSKSISLLRDGPHDGSSQMRSSTVNVYSGLCVERCLVNEMMSGAGSNGMWG